MPKATNDHTTTAIIIPFPQRGGRHSRRAAAVPTAPPIIASETLRRIVLDAVGDAMGGRDKITCGGIMAMRAAFFALGHALPDYSEI